ncbi:MAG TPA: homoserine kinase [Thermoleophilia bacterium]|nr:homoserine kinase [Thermoleophilia bacterium]
MNEGLQSCAVRVPATTGNLGPGFDCLGLALDLWNEARFVLGGEGVVVDVHGEGADRLPRDAENLTAQAALRVFAEAGKAPPAGLRIDCRVSVPLASGLGSSSTAVVAGLLGANELLGRPFGRDKLLEMAADFEGHPDNVAAALFGGLTIVVRKGDRLLTKKILVPDVHVALAVPDLSFSTRTARAGLPTEVAMTDAVFNLGRTPLVVEALRTGDFELLGQVMDDRLHQANRLALIPGGRAAWLAAQRAGAAAVAISGSGPSLIAFVSLASDAGSVARAMSDAFAAAGVAARPLGLTASAAGATVVRG